MQACIHTYMHTCIQDKTTHTYMHTYIYAYMYSGQDYAYIHTYAYMYSGQDYGSWEGLPSGQGCLDYFPSFDEGGMWKSWADSIPEFKHMWSVGEDADSVVVPTATVMQLRHCVELLHKQRHPVMLVGATGAGKTAVLKDYMAGLQGVKRVCITMHHGADTDLLQVCF